MTWLHRQSAALVLSATLLGGCASSITLGDPPVAKLTKSDRLRVVLGPFEGDQCFQKAVVGYLAQPEGLQLAGDGQPADVTISGQLRRIEVHSNLGDKVAALSYFTAFIITAPIAAVMYGAKDWPADAAAEGQITVFNRAGATAWTKELTVSVSETQRTMPDDAAVKTAMSGAACEKLATTLLNAFAEAVAANPGLVRP
jgi:hypothetical protein